MKGNKIKASLNTKCLINNTKDLISLWKLPNYPVTEQFGKYVRNFPKFNQELMISKSSGHVQLKKIVDQDFLYSPKNYKYRTTVNHSTKKALDEFLQFCKKINKNNINKSILDVGGNDNLIINKLALKQSKKYVIDPIAKKKRDGVIVINKFLDQVHLNKDILAPDLVICRHTLEHVPKPVQFISKLLNECDTACNFIFEVPSLERMISTKRFDTIMHQHLNYFSIDTLNMLINKCGGKIISYKIFKKGPCGGSILFAFKKNKNKKIIKKISKSKIDKKIIKIKQNISLYKKKMIELNKLLNSLNEKIFGYGAGLMLATYLYHLNIKEDKFYYIIDDDKRKHNWEYKNIKIKIKNIKKINLVKNQNFIITSLENKKVIHNKILSYKPNLII